MIQLIPPKSQELPEIGTAASDTAVNIKIEKKSGEYNGSTGGGTEQVTVLTVNNNSNTSLTCYTHYLTNGNKMNVTLKKGTETLQDSNSHGIPATSNVKYVHVYYGTSPTIPLLICVCINTGTKDTFKYYAQQGKPTADSKDWSEETDISGAPGNSNHTFLMHLDKLNDWANGQTVIHIEKMESFGVNGSKQYITGRDGNTQITVTKTVHNSEEPTQSKVPEGYVRYKHQGNISSPKFKHNGIELTFDQDLTGTVEAVFVYYHNDDSTEHQFPLIVCVYKSGSDYTYYQRGNKWTTIAGLNQDPETLNNTDLTKLQTSLDILKVMYEVKLGEDNNFKYGFSGEKINVENTDLSVPNYTGYKHQQGASATPFTIEKVSYNGSEIRGIVGTTPISGVTEVNVYYLMEDKKLEKPLLMYTKTGGNNYTNYRRGMKGGQMHWRDLRPGKTDALSADDLKLHLDTMFR